MARAGAAAALTILLLAAAGTAIPKASSFSLFPGVLQCWAAVSSVGDCSVKLVPSFLSLHIKVTPGCCKAVSDIVESCIPIVFPNPTFGAVLSNLTSTVCSALADTPPPLSKKARLV
ncbi:hypothetical protein HPP92_019675 [Vanilla planifolia]|uniref:Prolamin-like domain-containing protein n=1 Tax=Vanilla planifolia TaxID=51239 RepID=A0A835Q7C2_VANPL|nr:hypothetical protein HPP92_019675 [Vanilla planifolia]